MQTQASSYDGVTVKVIDDAVMVGIFLNKFQKPFVYDAVGHYAAQLRFTRP